jgi:outer membrane protein assembly factor BamA
MTVCRRPSSRNWAIAGLALLLAANLSVTATAQQDQPAPQDGPLGPTWAETPGLFTEPKVVARAAKLAAKYFDGEGHSDGFYVSTKSPIQGSGWISLGPGYRHGYKNDAVFIDGSAGISVRGYKVAQAQLEFPKLLNQRLTLGTVYRWQDFRAIKSYGVGPDTTEADASTYHLRSQNLTAYGTLILRPWLSANANLGWVEPDVRSLDLNEPRFLHSEASLVADTRDFPNHPTRGGLVRVSAAQFTDQDTSAFSFKRFESEAAGFLPLAGSRVVVAARGWLVASNTDHDRTVPEYLQPNFGGSHSLRSYPNFRFRDDNMLVGNVEVRVAMMTHLDVAVFADAGNVAAQWRDLDFDKRSYGAGLRFHTRRATIARVDVAHGREGWHALFSMSDPLSLSRTERRTAPFPFVP